MVMALGLSDIAETPMKSSRHLLHSIWPVQSDLFVSSAIYILQHQLSN